MIDAKDLNEFIIGIVNFIHENGYRPSTEELGNKLYLSRGAVEHRIEYLKDMGLITNVFRKGIHLTGEIYLPPTWAGDEDFLLEKLPYKNQHLYLSRSKNGSKTKTTRSVTEHVLADG